MTAPRRSPWHRIPHVVAGLVVAGCMGSDRAGAQGADDPGTLLRNGEHDAAVEALAERRSLEPGADATARLAEVLLELGRHAETERLLEDELTRSPGNAALLLLLGRSYTETGRLAEAERAFAAGADGAGGAALLAELRLAEALLRRGDQDEALDRFDRFIDIYNRSPSLGSRELQAVAGAVRNLGVTSSVYFQDALRAYDEAVAADPDNLEAHLETGFLFLDTYNPPDARASFRRVLERWGDHPRAILGMARAAEIEGSPEAVALAEQALEANPSLVPALVLRARIRLSGEDLAGGIADLERALEVNPASSEALAVFAAARLLQDDQDAFEDLRDRALALNPRDAGFFVEVAELASRARLYHRAVELAGRGVEVDSLAWEAYGVQGLNQLRTGEMAAGRRNLEIAFDGDPFNLWIKNTLDLLDVMDTFEESGTELVRVLVDPEDGEALAIYMREVAERAYHELSERYRYSPDPPVRIEAFRRSADFSVRTVGLTGLGALGVAFGTVLAMDSPSARGRDGFHWASTLWHEMAHAVHLGMTEHRVPRWLSEGLAVREERLAGPGWGMRPSLPFFAAYSEERLRPPSELSLSFVRPRFPEEVGMAYVLGSLVTEWIEDEWGFDAVLAMLDGYRTGLPPEEVLERETGLDYAAFDEAFDTWMSERYAAPIAAARAVVEAPPAPPGEPEMLEVRVRANENDVEARLALARIRIGEGRLDEAEELLREARGIFPENPDPQGPNRLLARIHGERGDDDTRIQALAEHVRHVAGDYGAHLELARLHEEGGRASEAARALEAAIHVYPFEPELHQRLARLYRTLGNGDGEVRERRVLLALDPVDRAGALYDLADAQYHAGELDEARETVVRALERAPRFPEAQELLLRILEGGPEG